MKVIITGATGLLGRSIYEEYKTDNRIQTVGLGYSRAIPPLVQMDLLNFELLEQFLQEQRPNLIIHCAAERRPDVAMKDEAKTLRLNVDLCRKLAELSNKLGFKLLYISTDYIFDGLNPPYDETASTNPLNFYGESKLNGEREVLKESRSIVLRVPILYGPTEYLDESAVNTLIKSVIYQREELSDDYLPRYPTNVVDISRALKQLASKDVVGIYNFSAKERFTKYEMCKLFAELLKLDLKLKPTKVQSGANRPFDCRLNTQKIESLGININCISFKSYFESFLKSFLILDRFDTELTVYRYGLDSGVVPLITNASFYSFTLTKDEISIIQPSNIETHGYKSNESGWVYFKVRGPLDFSLKGIIARLTQPLANSIPVFVVSTFDTDYILVKKENASAASAIWDSHQCVVVSQ